jgi:hypothetical protein
MCLIKDLSVLVKWRNENYNKCMPACKKEYEYKRLPRNVELDFSIFDLFPA